MLDHFTRWCNRWKLVLNKDTCETLTITGRMKVGMDKPTLYILGTQVEQVETLRYLGLYLDSKLTFETHLQKIEGSLAGRLCSLYNLTANYDVRTSTLLSIYKTQIRPVWEYGCMFFALTHTKLERLQKIQNRFLRLTFPTAKSSSIAIIHRIADLETVEQRVWFNRIKLLNKFALSPTDHPLFQLRVQLYNQLVRPKKKCFYLFKAWSYREEDTGRG